MLLRAVLVDDLRREGADEVHIVCRDIGSAALDNDALKHEITLRQMLTRVVPLDDVGLARLYRGHLTG